MNELISVVVPVYKVEEYLDECVSSIVNQTYKNLEIILVDDGSPDKCPQMCDKWAAKDSRVKVIHQENKGVAEARKNGILSASGEYVCCVDSDDFIDLKTTESVLKVFEENNVEIVVFDSVSFGEASSKSTVYPKMPEGVLDNKTALKILVKGDIPNYFCNKMYKRRVFEGVDFVENRLWEDMGAMYQVFLNAENIYFLPEFFYHYRMRADSTIHSITDKALEDIFFVQTKRYYDLLKINTEIAEIAFARVPWAAIRLYDRSLWAAVDGDLLKKAIDFLNDNKEKILKLNDKKRFKWFYRNRKIYDTIRRLRHKVGNIIKK